ncbi:HD-GYP domain-containing protein [Niallia sp. NCCP-28]|uniref:HD-GYP domain-containing protein n=1 Tax=Niallia sp. NCCP-28 TaxID=2934712 RepID=UPI00208B56C1|nr:HD-GYP domain-containing protein [Niallia sp. NCCP-28]GKU83893.1 HD family phosphohydrolase [Niallia sp. NCCP-28]
MKVNTSNLRAGCILAEDVFKLTSKPIISAKTVLTAEHINILRAFLVQSVVIENTQIDGSEYIDSLAENVQTEREKKKEEESFFRKFLKSVQKFKKEFKSWQSGRPVNIANVRFLLLPLLKDIKFADKEIFSLYHLSNKEEYLYQHSIAVAVISAYIAHKLNYDNGEIIQIALAGCLSDVGMARINPRLLTKAEPLTEEEFQEVKEHTRFSVKMIPEQTLIKNDARLSILQHHERLDGSGYPLGNRDIKIHPYAKIIAVADTFHAMTSERLYRQKQSPFKVLEQLYQDYFGKYEFKVLNALRSGIIRYTIGSQVRLSNGDKGEVLFIQDKSPTRPLIKLLSREDIIDLEKNRHLFIEEILDYKSVL